MSIEVSVGECLVNRCSPLMVEVKALVENASDNAAASAGRMVRRCRGQAGCFVELVGPGEEIPQESVHVEDVA